MLGSEDSSLRPVGRSMTRTHSMLVGHEKEVRHREREEGVDPGKGKECTVEFLLPAAIQKSKSLDCFQVMTSRNYF